MAQPIDRVSNPMTIGVMLLDSELTVAISLVGWLPQRRMPDAMIGTAAAPEARSGSLRSWWGGIYTARQRVLREKLRNLELPAPAAPAVPGRGRLGPERAATLERPPPGAHAHEDQP